ncbi:aspartyl-phosphate phosphatase Spo0E family protein [Paenibacillus swuensis]|uniref:aspartyl-phosphate phosphatase Spo0E family protein n=1 Tax=Paenibacillus swuensis TaxID=1178515 RepID=UPI0009ED7BB6|nr:aspartyl-phosphate phosphatase Spo0E family protein [Paenibacillus swuensis]
MTSQPELSCEIDQLKKLLENTAEKYKYNFGHPQVLAISQKLDGLILKVMKDKTMI